MWGNWSATILSFFMMTVMLGSIIAVTMPSSYVQGSDNNDIEKLELSTIDNQVDTKRLAKVHLPFIENNGQVNEDVKYYASTFAGTAFVTEDGITYSLMKSSPKGEVEDIENQIQSVALKESFLTDNALHPTGLEKSDSIVNYFVGDEENWRSNVPTYNAVSFGEIWPSVDVELKAYGANIEKIFNVNPGGSVEDIRLSLDGVLSLNVDEEGELILETELGDLAMTKPIAFQNIEGLQKNVEVSYLVDGSTYGFAVGDYDPHHPLFIDPLLASTFIGGSGEDQGRAIVLDSSGNVFVTGRTSSSDYPTTAGAFDETYNGQYDAFVTKLKSDLSGPLLASTFIGGGGEESGHAIALDSSGIVFVTGQTTSRDYPTTTGAFDETFDGDRDVFVTKLDSNLSILLASTYIGGRSCEFGYAIALDSSDNVFVTGETCPPNYPTTTGAFDETHNGLKDVFVTKLDNNLSILLASTFIGGSTSDSALAITLDSSGNVLVTGRTTSPNYPTTTGAFDETLNGSFDVFVTKLKSDLSGPLLASTFIGGTGFDFGFAIALDSSDNVFVTGQTTLPDYPTTTGAFDETFDGDVDVFVTKLKNDLSGPLLASTFIGGFEDERGFAIALDSSDNVFVTGRTTSPNYPTTTGAFDETHNGDFTDDVFVTKLKSDLSGPLLASTFIGGGISDSGRSFGDTGFAITLDSSGNVFVTGETRSNDYPTTTGAFDETHNGDFTYDVFVTKLTGDLLLMETTEELTCNFLEPTIIGTEDNDDIVGTNEVDVIHGLGGNDTIQGLGGDDIICGGDGDDKIFGGDGIDTILGENGNDFISLGKGNDTAFGGPGNDQLFGGEDADELFGGEGNDNCHQGESHDSCEALTFFASLEGEQEVPPVSTDASGVANFRYNSTSDEMKFIIEVENLDLDGNQTGDVNDDVMAAHIHLAPSGVNGPIVVGFISPETVDNFQLDPIAGVISGIITSDSLINDLAGQDLSALIAEMISGNTYVNIHTVGNPTGEVRGQI